MTSPCRAQRVDHGAAVVFDDRALSVWMSVHIRATEGRQWRTNDYVYGPLVMGGAAPVEQFSVPTSSNPSPTPSFCFSTPSGVQAVVTQAAGSPASSLSELATYAVTGIRSVGSTSVATPFGFQGAYQDPTGLDYLYNRSFDPSSAQFLSVDPKLLTTEDPYSLDGGDTLNMSDPLGLYEGCIGESCPSGSGWREGNGKIACSSNCGSSYPTSSGNSYSEDLQSYIDARNQAIGQDWIAGAEYGAAVALRSAERSSVLSWLGRRQVPGDIAQARLIDVSSATFNEPMSSEQYFGIGGPGAPKPGDKGCAGNGWISVGFATASGGLIKSASDIAGATTEDAEPGPWDVIPLGIAGAEGLLGIAAGAGATVTACQ